MTMIGALLRLLFQTWKLKTDIFLLPTRFYLFHSFRISWNFFTRVFPTLFPPKCIHLCYLNPPFVFVLVSEGSNCVFLKLRILLRFPSNLCRTLLFTLILHLLNLFVLVVKSKTLITNFKFRKRKKNYK